MGLIDNGSAPRKALLAVLAEQEAVKASDAKTRRELAFLQDVHLAALLQRLDQPEKSTFLETSAHVSSAGEVCVVVHGQRLGAGWLGRATFVSAVSSRRLEITVAPEPCDSGSVFRCRPPTLLEEMGVQLSLVFAPEYPVPAFVSAPATTHICSFHIDALDAAVPCTQQARTAKLGRPFACEIWLVLAEPGAADSTSLRGLAHRLLPALLFENLPPHARGNAARIMAGKHTAEFGLATADDCQDTAVVMCLPEHDHLAIRIQSTSHRIYGAVVAAVASRLSLLLGSAAMDHAALDTLHKRCASLAGKDTGPLGHVPSSIHADFAAVKHIDAEAFLDRIALK